MAKISIYKNEFLIFPRNIPPFYLINLKNRKIFKSGLQLFTATTIKHKIIVKAMVVMYDFLDLFLKVEMENKKIEKVLKFINEFSSERYYNLYFSSWDKIVVQLFEKESNIKSYLKLVNENKKYSVVNEYKNIKSLEKYNIKTFIFPSIKLFSFDNRDTYSYIELSAPEKAKKITSSKLNNSIVDLVVELFTSSVKTKIVSDIVKLEDLYKDITCTEQLSGILDKYKNIKLPLGIVHNDFKLWNILFDKKSGKYFVFDWEEMSEEGIPLADLFTFTVFTEASLNIGISGYRLYNVFKKNIEFYRRFLYNIGSDYSDEFIIFLLILFLIEIIGRENFWDRWESNETRPVKIRNSLIELLEYCIDRGV